MSEQMDRRELRIFLQGWFCGCGNPEAAAGFLLRLLRLHPCYDHRPELEALFDSNSGLEHLTLYTLDRYELTEHGGSVGGAWLTDKGSAVRDALAREEADEFETLLDDACVHGYDVSDQDHDCMAPDADAELEAAKARWSR